MQIPQSSVSIQASIACKQFFLKLQLEKPESISAFPTATLRGGFGITLRKLVCPTVDVSCNQCILRHNCVYAYIFETIPAPDSPRLKNYHAVPHPFTLWCKQNQNSMDVSLLLIGKAIKSLPYFIYTFRKLGTQGLGKSKNHFLLQSVKTDDIVVYEQDNENVNMQFNPESVLFSESENKKGSCILNFYSPLVLRKDGVIVNGYDNHAFFSTLLRRITSLFTIHCDGGNFEDCKPLLKKWNEEIQVQAFLSSVGAIRYSTRQQREIDYNGFTGKIKLSGNLGAFFSFLKAGEILSVGKNTAFGFGRYRIEDVVWDG
jgi:CRISPR-associated endoribonuclease Cas6